MAVDAVPVVMATPLQGPEQEGTEEVPVPPQYSAPRVQDFRFAGFAPKGYKQNAVKTGSSKRKLDEYQTQVRHCLLILYQQGVSAYHEA